MNSKHKGPEAGSLMYSKDLKEAMICAVVAGRIWCQMMLVSSAGVHVHSPFEALTLCERKGQILSILNRW